MNREGWRRWLQETPDAHAVVWTGGAWSWRELAVRVDEYAAGLERGGLGPADTVALEATAGPAFVLELLALWRLGAVAAPVHPRLTDPERQQQDELLRPGWALTRDRGPGGELAPRGGSLRSLRPGGLAVRCLDVPWESRTGAVLLTTSGSTGAPRGVLLSHEALEASARATAERLQLGVGDRWGLLLSPAHAGGLSTIVRALLLGGGLRMWPAAERPRGAVESISRGEVSHLSVVPALADALFDEGLQGPPTSFRCLLIGGAATGRGLRKRSLEARVPLGLTWGMTETGGQVATSPPSEVREGGDTVGLPLSGMKVAVRPGGHLVVRGPFLASGLLAGPEGPVERLPVDAGGWYATNDLGEWARNGRLRILGRADDIIVSGGTNVHPAEVEEVLSRHHGVRTAGVVGLPDERWGEVVVAAVVTRGEHPPTEEALKEWCGAYLTRSRCPTHIVFLPELPLTRSGKVARGRLAALLSQPGPGGPGWDREPRHITDHDDERV